MEGKKAKVECSISQWSAGNGRTTVPRAGMNSTEKHNKAKHCLLCITALSCYRETTASGMLETCLKLCTAHKP